METKTQSPLASSENRVRTSKTNSFCSITESSTNTSFKPLPAEPESPSISEMQMLLDDIRVSISIARRQEHEATQNARFKPFLAESAESTRLKAKLSGLWNQNLPLAEFAEAPKLIN